MNKLRADQAEKVMFYILFTIGLLLSVVIFYLLSNWKVMDIIQQPFNFKQYVGIYTAVSIAASVFFSRLYRKYYQETENTMRNNVCLYLLTLQHAIAGISIGLVLYMYHNQIKLLATFTLHFVFGSINYLLAHSTSKQYRDEIEAASDSHHY